MMVTEQDLNRVVRGPADLEEQIAQLKKQVEFLQGKCRQAGAAILDQELRIKTLTQEINRLSEENFNLSLVGGKKNDKR
tara:strand:+ start:276 stop:512 length:237 start_codon:yes stop_codon:yes gene_type:complete